MKSRPDYHETTWAIISMNKEAGQNPKIAQRNKCRDDLDPEILKWLIWLSLTQLKVVLRCDPTLRFHTVTPSRIGG